MEIRIVKFFRNDGLPIICSTTEQAFKGIAIQWMCEIGHELFDLFSS